MGTENSGEKNSGKKSGGILKTGLFILQVAILLGLGGLGLLLLLPEGASGPGPEQSGSGALPDAPAKGPSGQPADLMTPVPRAQEPASSARSSPSGSQKKRVVEVRALNSKGQPLAGADAWCEQKKGTGPFTDWDVFRKARTGLDGLTWFKSLPPGGYRILVFDANDFVERMITVTESEPELKLDFTFRDKGVIRGTVCDPDGRPLLGAMVKAHFLDRRLSSWPEEFKNDATAFADEKGVFSLECIPPGFVTIKTSMDERITSTMTGIGIAEGSNQSLKIVLEPCAVVEGAVSIARGMKPSECGLSACCMYILRENGTVSIQTTAVPVSDEDGSFRFEVDTFDCVAVFHISAQGFKPLWAKLEVAKGERKRLEPSLDEPGGVFKGKVVLPEGKGMEVMQIKVSKAYASEKEELEDYRIWDPVFVEAGADGVFSCDSLDRCACRATFVVIKPTGGTWETERVFTPDVSDMRIDVPEDW